MEQITYIKTGDYYIPNLKLPEGNRPIGRWGRMHRDYLKGYRPVVFNQLVLSGNLWSYLADINVQAQQRMEVLVKQMMSSEGVTEELKEVQGPKFNFYPTYTWLGKNAERLVLNRINEYYDSKQGIDYYYGSAFVANQYDLGSFGAYVSSPVGGRSVVPIESALSSRRTHKLGPIPQENDM